MNNKIVVYVLVIAIIIFGAFYFFKPSNTTQQNQIPTTQIPATTNAQDQTPVTQTSDSAPIQAAPINTVSAKTYNISIANFAFSPASLNINKGDTVVWTNNDSVPHQISGNSLNGQVMNKGQTYSFTFNDTGTFNYHCAIHPSMTASITVQ